ncbi:MAG TPA: tetratricopeptide repeat protein [archaeon]|nr:tetratricopeptide repeat protein [archaeon]
MAFDKRKALQSALTYSQQGRWDKAIAEYQAILKVDPHDLTVSNNLGDLYARAGKAAEAIEQYLKLGELYRADGLSVKAIAVYKKIIKLDPKRTQALLACADLYEEQGLTGEARIQLATVVEQYAKAADTGKVIETYQRLAALDQTNHTVLTKLADLLHKVGRREEAVAQYELAARAAEGAGLTAESKRLWGKARELTPKSFEATLAQVEQLLHEGKHAQAVETLLKVTPSDQTNAPQAWRLLGEAYVELGQASEAIAALEQAVGLGLPEREVWRPLAKASVVEGHMDDGVALCQKLTEDALSRNKPDEAVTICQEIAALAPNLAPIHACLVRLLQNLGRDDEARASTRALAAAHEACGETQEAVHVYRQLLEDDPTDGEVQARLAALGAPSVAPAASEELPVPEVESKAAPEVEVEPPVLEEPGVAESAPAEFPLAETAPIGLAPPEPSLAEPAPAELPASEPSSDIALALGNVTALGLEEGIGPEGHADQVYELDESGELAGIRYASRGQHGPGMEGAAALGGPAIEGSGESLGKDALNLPSLGDEESGSGEAAERLAEAEVYLKYGLTEKAREQLLEAVQISPENLTTHRRLKALYIEGGQTEEACQEVLAIARILQALAQFEAAQRELQEGLGLAPGNAALEGMLADLSGRFQQPEASAMAEPVRPVQPPEEPSLEVAQGLAGQGEVTQSVQKDPVLTEAPGVTEIGAFEGPTEKEPVFELPDRVGGPTSLEEDLPPELRSLLEGAGEEPALVVETPEASLEQAMGDDLAEAEFYLSQGMVEEARAVLRRMRGRDTKHPAVGQLEVQIESSTAGSRPESGVSVSPGPGEATSFAGLLDSAAPGRQAELPQISWISFRRRYLRSVRRRNRRWRIPRHSCTRRRPGQPERFRSRRRLRPWTHKVFRPRRRPLTRSPRNFP